ncbi:hypothetical protein P8935_21925 [Telmatobacter sp. DSM 110680]|uniref:Core-binding (CB) domain-containing protein n=1 Tax=Telmatobacter sp. DSM 110680 TaxID=3036704 RepID=A0AAU7DGN2_9BACT
MPPKTWQAEFKRLWKELVPLQGQAATVQGEVIRAVGRLSDEAYRNGNCNFRKGHRMLCQFLRANLEDPDVFSATEISEIDNWIDRILDAKNPDLSGSTSPYYRLTERAVKWCQSKPDLIPHKPNSALRI